MKKYISITLITISFVVIFGYQISREDKLYIPVSNDNSDIIDLTVESKKLNNYWRYQALQSLTNTDPQYDKETKYNFGNIDNVLIGTYRSDTRESQGGILMLKQLPENKFSLFWEIKSHFFYTPAIQKKEYKDITGDGIKELITISYSEYVAGNNIAYQYWIFTLDPETKTYKVLNPIYDDKGERLEITDFENTSVFNPLKLNRFQTPSFIDSVIKDLDGDGVYEIIITNPVLEDFLLIPYPKDIEGKDTRLGYKQIWKWDGNKYYIWKQEYIKDKSETY